MKIPLLYGAGITFFSSVIMLVTHLLGYWTDPNKLMTGMIVGGGCGLIILVTGITLGTRRVRNDRGPGGFTYGQAFRSGLLVAVFAALCGIVFNVIFFQVLVPDFADTQVEWMRSMLERMGAPADKIEEAVEGIRAKATLGHQIRNSVLSTIAMGAIVSLITSAFLKRNVEDEPPTLP